MEDSVSLWRASPFDSFAVSPSPLSAGPSQPPISFVIGVYFGHMSLSGRPLRLRCLHPPVSSPFPLPSWLSCHWPLSSLSSFLSRTSLSTTFFLLSSSTGRALVVPALCIVTVSRLFFCLPRLNSRDNQRQRQIEINPGECGTMRGCWGKPHATSDSSAACGDDAAETSQVRLTITFNRAERGKQM